MATHNNRSERGTLSTGQNGPFSGPYLDCSLSVLSLGSHWVFANITLVSYIDIVLFGSYFSSYGTSIDAHLPSIFIEFIFLHYLAGSRLDLV